jgi:hypothetical protein
MEKVENLETALKENITPTGFYHSEIDTFYPNIIPTGFFRDP